MDKLKLKKFGMLMGFALALLSLVFWIRGDSVLSALSLASACLFFAAGLAWPFLLEPVYTCWMFAGSLLGWINTRIILVVIFYLVISPMGVLMRLCGADFLERKNKEDSYWKKREGRDFCPSEYERRF